MSDKLVDRRKGYLERLHERIDKLEKNTPCRLEIASRIVAAGYYELMRDIGRQGMSENETLSAVNDFIRAALTSAEALIKMHNETNGEK